MSKKLLQYYRSKMDVGGKVLPKFQVDGLIPIDINERSRGDIQSYPSVVKNIPLSSQQLLANKKAIEERTKAENAKILADRAARIQASINARKQPFSAQRLADKTQAIGDKFRLFPNDPNSFIDEYLNPGVLIGNMASGLGRVPLNIQQGNYGQAAWNVASPLATGALAGIGAKGTSQFVNNLVNPLAGVSPNSVKSIYKSIPKNTENFILFFDDSSKDFLKNKSDLKYLEEWGKRFGYSLPENSIDKIAQSNLLTDRTVRGLMNRHNSFARGVSTNWGEVTKVSPETIKHLQEQGIDYINNPKAAAEYMATHVPIKTNYGRSGLPEDVLYSNKDALYTSNSFNTAEGYTYGNGYVVKSKLPTDFSSINRRDWIAKNDPNYLSPYSGKSLDDLVKQTTDNGNFQIYKTEGLDLKLNKNINDYTKSNTQFFYKDNLNFPYVSGLFEQKKYMTDILPSIKKIAEDLSIKYNIPNLEKKLLKSHDNDPFDNKFNIIGQIKYTNLLNKLIKQENKYSKAFDSEIKKYLTNEYGLGWREKLNKIQYKEKDLKNPRYGHYLFIGSPGQKILDPIKTIKINPDNYINQSRSHIGEAHRQLSGLKYGGPLPKFQIDGLVPIDYSRRASSDKTRFATPYIQPFITAEEARKKELAEYAKRAAAKQSYVGPGPTANQQLIRDAAARERNIQQIRENSPLTQTMGSMTPSGYNPGAGAIGAEMFVNMNPLGSGQIMSTSRISGLLSGQNPYGFSTNNGVLQNALGALGLIGDVTMLNPNAASTVNQGVKTIGKQLTTKTPLRNAYKINPNLENPLGFRNVGDKPHWWKGYTKEVTPETIDLQAGFPEYLKKYTKIDDDLYKARFNKKGETRFSYDEFLKRLGKERSKLLEKTPLGKELGFGSYGTVNEFKNYPQTAVKIGQPFGPRRWNQQLINELAPLREKGNIAIPSRLEQFNTPLPYPSKGTMSAEVSIMDNLNTNNFNKLNLSGRDAYALLLKQARQLRDKGVYLDFSNFDNFKFNPKKGVWDIYDINPGLEPYAPSKYMLDLKYNLDRKVGAFTDLTKNPNFQARNERVKNAFFNKDAGDIKIPGNKNEYYKYLEQQEFKNQLGNVLRKEGTGDVGGMYQAPSNKIEFKDPWSKDVVYRYEAEDFNNFKMPEDYRQAQSMMSESKRQWFQNQINQRNKQVNELKKLAEYGNISPLFNKPVNETLSFPSNIYTNYNRSDAFKDIFKKLNLNKEGGEIDEYKLGLDILGDEQQFKDGGSLNRTVTCSNCGWSWKLVDGGKDPMTCHQCGGQIKMQEGGSLPEYQTKGQVKEKTIYVDDPNHFRLKAYQDSSRLYNKWNTKGWKEMLNIAPNVNMQDIYNIPYSSKGEYKDPKGRSIPIGSDYLFGSNWREIVKKTLKDKIKPLGYLYSDLAVPVYKKPVERVKYRKPVVAQPQIVPTQQPVAPVQPIPPAYRMQGNTPVYGPSNSLIGMLNEESGEFYPDYMNTAGRARVNQADADIIGNQQNILEYLRMKGVNNPKVIPQKQVGGPIFSTEGFKQGPPPQGSYYRIPSNTLYNPTPYRIKAVANTGQVEYLNPFDDSNINFPGADYVDEYPMMKQGGSLPKYQVDGWVRRAANADLNFWEKCGLSLGRGRDARGGSGGGGRDKQISYFDNCANLDLDVNPQWNKDDIKRIKNSVPEGLDKKIWYSMNTQANFINRQFNPHIGTSILAYGEYADPATGRPYDKYLADEYRPKINIPEGYRYYMKTPLKDKKTITAQDIYEYHKSLPGGIEGYPELINRYYSLPKQQVGGENEEPRKRKSKNQEPPIVYTESPEFMQSFNQGRNWVSDWYTQKAKNPQFTDVANKRIDYLSKDPKFIYEDQGSETLASYIPGKDVFSRNIKFLENDANPNTWAHENLHRASINIPQKFDKGIINSINKTTITIPEAKKMKIPANIYWYLKSPQEREANLMDFRRDANIDPNKQYTNEEMLNLMKPYIEFQKPSKEKDQYTPDEIQKGIIQRFLKGIRNNPESLNFLNNSIVGNINTGIPFAKSGGQHGGIDRWFAEKWVDIKTGKPCGRQEGESRAYPACRPSKRVSSQTPKTRSEMSSSEKAKFKQVKTSSKRIPYNHKKK